MYNYLPTSEELSFYLGMPRKCMYELIRESLHAETVRSERSDKEAIKTGWGIWARSPADGWLEVESSTTSKYMAHASPEMTLLQGLLFPLRDTMRLLTPEAPMYPAIQSQLSLTIKVQPFCVPSLKTIIS